MGEYFGTDGIRGTAGDFPMTASIAMKVAMAAAHVLRSKNTGPQQNRVVIGKDTRLSCYMVEQAMTAGFLAMGCDVLLTGPIPTPGVSMLTRSLRADLGVMISASHNLYHDNGIKLFAANGRKLPDRIESEIEMAIKNNEAEKHTVGGPNLGKASRLDDVTGRYVEFVKSTFPKKMNLSGLKIVVDCAHGAAYKVAPQALWELEAEIVTIGNAPNGRNINDGFGATDTGNLQKAVVECGADIGVALDGDADRLIIIDEKGARIDGDQLMTLIASNMQEKNRLAKDTVVATIMSNLGMERYLELRGITMKRAQVGDRYVMEMMREGGYNFGGEQSGHMIFSDFAPAGDGLLAALQVLAIVKEKGRKVSEICHVFDPLPQILKNVRFENRAALPSVDDQSVQDAIALAESDLGEQGRILVRPSGTEPIIRVMAEGDDKRLVEKTVNDLCQTIEQVS